MNFMGRIIDALNFISQYFYELYLDCHYAGFPLDIIAYWFYWLSTFFSDLAWAFYDFSGWVNDVATKIVEILSWSTIWSYILTYVPNLEAIRDWFYYWWDYVWGVIADWWSTTYLTVQGWIDIATEGLDALKIDWSNFWNITFPEWTGKLDNLKASWDFFWTETLPTLVSFSWLITWWDERLLDVQNLINSAFVIRDDFWRGWQDLRDDVTEFFTDPEDWLYKAFDRIIERFW